MNYCRCIICSKLFFENEIVGKNCCPGCGTRLLPLDPKDDVEIKINIGELRILGIWSENWGILHDDKNLDNINWESMKETVNLITQRIRKQLKEKNKDFPLTLTQELSNIKDVMEGKIGNIQYYVGGKEQIIE